VRDITITGVSSAPKVKLHITMESVFDAA